MRGLTRAILIRHADPAEEARGRCYGTTDIGLSPRGERRARHLANMLRRMPIDAVYTSPSRRAVDTAAALAAAHDLTPVELDDLRELDFGACEGRTYDEIAAEEPELFRTWMLTPTQVRFPGGESYAQLCAALWRLRASFAAATRPAHSPSSATVASSARSSPMLSPCPMRRSSTSTSATAASR